MDHSIRHSEIARSLIVTFSISGKYGVCSICLSLHARMRSMTSRLSGPHNPKRVEYLHWWWKRSCVKDNWTLGNENMSDSFDWFESIPLYTLYLEGISGNSQVAKTPLRWNDYFWGYIPNALLFAWDRNK